MYPEADYSLYKFARTRHGFWFWFIHLLAIGGHPYTLIVGDWHWSWIVVTVVVEFVYWRVIVWSHRDRLRKMNEKGPGSPHQKTVCEKCKPQCYRSKDPAIDGSPLSLFDWVRASRHKSERWTHEFLDSLSGAGAMDLHEEYGAYLDNRKFDKFLLK